MVAANDQYTLDLISNANTTGIDQMNQSLNANSTAMKGVASGATDASAGVGGFADKAKSLRSNAAFGIAEKGMKSIANTALDMAASMDTMNAEFRAQTGKSGEELEAFSKSAHKLYETNVVPIEEIGAVLTDVGKSMGMYGAEGEEMAQHLLDLSKVAGGSATQWVGTFDAALDSFKMTTQENYEFMDQLAASSQTFGTDVGVAGGAIKKMGASLQKMGMDAGEGLTLINAFEESGINASMGFRALKSAARTMPTGTELMPLLKQINETADATERGTLATQVFGKAAGDQVALALDPARGALEDWNVTVDESRGTAEEAANAIEGTFSNKMKMTSNKIKGTIGEIGSSFGDLLPAASAAMTALPAIGSMLPGGLGGLATTIGPMLFSPPGLIAALVAGIGVMIVSPEIRNAVFNLAGKVVGFLIEGIKGLAGGIIDTVGRIFNDPGGLLNDLFDAGKEAVGSFVEGMNEGGEMVTGEEAQLVEIPPPPIEEIRNYYDEYWKAANAASLSGIDRNNIAEMNSAMYLDTIPNDQEIRNAEEQWRKFYDPATAGTQEQADELLGMYNTLWTQIADEHKAGAIKAAAAMTDPKAQADAIAEAERLAADFADSETVAWLNRVEAGLGDKFWDIVGKTMADTGEISEKMEGVGRENAKAYMVGSTVQFGKDFDIRTRDEMNGAVAAAEEVGTAAGTAQGEAQAEAAVTGYSTWGFAERLKTYQAVEAEKLAQETAVLTQRAYEDAFAGLTPQAAQQEAAYMEAMGKSLPSSMVAGIKSGIPDLKAEMAALTDLRHQEKLWEKAGGEALGADFVDKITKGMNSKKPDVQAAARATALVALEAIDKSGKSGPKAANKIGRYLSGLYATGMTRGQINTYLAGKGVSLKALEGVAATKGWHATGTGDTQGYTQGLESDKALGYVETATGAVMGAVTGGLAPSDQEKADLEASGKLIIKSWSGGAPIAIQKGSWAYNQWVTAADRARAVLGNSLPTEGPLTQPWKGGMDIAKSWSKGLADNMEVPQKELDAVADAFTAVPNAVAQGVDIAGTQEMRMTVRLEDPDRAADKVGFTQEVLSRAVTAGAAGFLGGMRHEFSVVSTR